MRGRVGRILKAVAALGLATSLAACSAHPGAAVKTGGKTYSEDQITTVVDQYGQMFGQAVSRDDVVVYLAEGPIYGAVAAKHKVAVSDAQVREAIASTQKSGGLAALPRNLDPGTLDILRIQLETNRIQSLGLSSSQLNKELRAAATGARIQVSPRYGSVNAQGVANQTTLADVLQQQTSSTGQSGQ